MEIRTDRQNGMSFAEIARKYHLDPRGHARGEVLFFALQIPECMRFLELRNCLVCYRYCQRILCARKILGYLECFLVDFNEGLSVHSMEYLIHSMEYLNII